MTSDKATSVFDRFAPPIQRWIWQQGWSGLRPVQTEAANAIFDSDGDVVVAAATAGGKTEAAFLPILSQVFDHPADERGFEVLAISPLKALINDQYGRLESLVENTGLPVHCWHGDVGETAKRKARDRPAGILVITPESLEAMLVRQGNAMPARFAALRFIVVDELHAFIGTERGIQLQSLMHRIEQIIGRTVRRIGLSATLGDLYLAARALRPMSEIAATTIAPPTSEAELLLQIRGHQRGRLSDELDGQEKDDDAVSVPTDDECSISNHIFKTLRGKTNLVFAGSRSNVETFADSLRLLCESDGVPNEFLPHHGSLARDIRQDVEKRLKEGGRPLTAVCTTTLELGIDIGNVEAVAQIGPSTSVSSLRQRLGRSGRRPGAPSILRMYVSEDRLEAKTSFIRRLRLDTALAVASVRQLISGWCEPPPERALHSSTLVHQILALVCQNGGVAPAPLYALLCGSGPFGNISQTDFAILLRHLGPASEKLLEQSPDGTLMLGPAGERIVEHYSFYAVFETPEEWRVESSGRMLGTVPVDGPLRSGQTILFAGRRWTIADIREREKTVNLLPGSSGAPIFFGGAGGKVHDRLALEVRAVLAEGRSIPYLDRVSASHLEEGRSTFAQLDRAGPHLVSEGEETLVLPWLGSIKLATIGLALTDLGIPTSVEGLSLRSKGKVDEVSSALKQLSSGQTDVRTLALSVENKLRHKFDLHVPNNLLSMDFTLAELDEGAFRAI